MNQRPLHDHSLVIAASALFIMNSPFTDWWANLGLPWYAMFLPWGLVIAFVWWNQRDASR